MNRGDTAAARPSVLVVDDDLYLLAAIKQTLTLNGYAATTCGNPLEALARLGDQPFAAVLADIRMPEMNGMVLLERILERDPDLPVILITGHGDISLAVEAVKKGAYHFLQKPVDEDIILATLERAIERRQLVLENRRLEEQLTRTRETRSRFYGLVGSHPSMLELYRLIETIAHEPDPVLIIGETGTGKELVARALHDRSQQRHMPLIKVNCAAIPETLVEAELFGHEKGAFTGADRRRPGRFELASRGTLLLDEVGELPLAVQAKVLRVLDDGRFERVGGGTTLAADVRLVAATNRDLAQMVAAGEFRADLLYRLEIFPIELPPLRDRASDIALVARHLAAEISARLKLQPFELAPDALDLLAAEPWPGNVRQLANVLERAAILAPGERLSAERVAVLLGRKAFVEPASPAGTATGEATAGETLDELRRALREAGGDKRQAATALGISYRTLLRRIEEHDLKGYPRYRD